MKKYFLYVALVSLLVAVPVLAHHAAEGILDEEIYAMIDDMVSDTTHATLEFSDMGGSATEITITTQSVRDVENMIDDGLLEYAAMLDGDVSLVIEFDDQGGGATVLITEAE